MSDAWRYAVSPDPRSRSRSLALQSWKSFHFYKLSSLPCHLQWDLATDHWFVNSGTISKYDQVGFFDICPSFCVTWLWVWQKSQLWRVDRQSRTWRSRTGLFFSVEVRHLLVSPRGRSIPLGGWCWSQWRRGGDTQPFLNSYIMVHLCAGQSKCDFNVRLAGFYREGHSTI